MADMLKGKTSAGFVYEVDPVVLDDMELVEDLAEVDENPLKLPKVITTVLGKEQKKAFYDFYRKDGRVSIGTISAAFVEILSTSNQGKN